MTGISRRSALAMFGGASMAPFIQPAFAQGVEGRKFIFIILRGALDGLATLIPDDKETESLRGDILPTIPERLDLQNGFRLHPSLANIKTLYDEGDVAFIHAAATPYRSRSHFEGQDALETLGRGEARDGWLNRALQANGGAGLAVGRAVPLALQGKAPASNWSPPVFDAAPEDLLNRLSNLYADDMAFAEPLAMARAGRDGDAGMGPRQARRFTRQYAVVLEAVGKLMAAEGGPGVGMAALDGWDTHANQKGELTRKLRGLDEGLAALKTELGAQWDQTCIAICSEFGRTAAANGTNGTDHGTGGLMMLAGGAVSGGRMHGDWPGLKKSALYEGRDLAPANDVAAVLKGALRDHLGLEQSKLDNLVFPNSSRAVDGLIRM